MAEMTWEERITRAENRWFWKRFTFEDKSLARNLRTCAVGELVQRYPTIVKRSVFNPLAPLDLLLAHLGADFADAVDRGLISRARVIYERIHHRFTELSLADTIESVREKTNHLVDHL